MGFDLEEFARKQQSGRYHEIGVAFDRRTDLVDPNLQRKVCDKLYRAGVDTKRLFRRLRRSLSERPPTAKQKRDEGTSRSQSYRSQFSDLPVFARTLEAAESCYAWSLAEPLYNLCLETFKTYRVERCNLGAGTEDFLWIDDLAANFLEALSVPLRAGGWLMNPERSEARRDVAERLQAATNGRIVLPQPTTEGIQHFRNALRQRYVNLLRVNVCMWIMEDLKRRLGPIPSDSAFHKERRRAYRLTADVLRSYFPDLAGDTTTELVRKQFERYLRWRAPHRGKTRKVTQDRPRNA